MEIIQIPGYTEEEKLQIARRYLVKRQLEANGLKPEQCEITGAAIRAIITDYTREAGVRNLEREIGAVFRNVAMRIAEGTIERARIDVDDLPAILGPRKFENEVAMRVSVPGVATGLGLDAGGGRHPVHRGVQGGGLRQADPHRPARRRDEGKRPDGPVSGQGAGAVRRARERWKSRTSTSTCRRGRRPRTGLRRGWPSSPPWSPCLCDKPVRNDVAMTGEISLRGLVLPVGGIKEKVLAALRAGITTVLLPARNKRDLEEIPEDARKRLTFVWLETVDDALRAAIGGDLATSERREAPAG
ncbi:MAG: hypothetical protein KatS3mg123_2449 [Burkholderiales bacterium]|nr:MAG: hypothetical protein KatS3mg123_2449 [Burkholderiales bacterium]